MNRPAPSLTAIMIMPYSFDRLLKAVGSLRRQTIRQQIEIILVHALDTESEVDAGQFRQFHSFHRVQLHKHFHLEEAFAAGFAVATAPVVAYIEDHVTINAEWAEVLVEAHRGPWVLVAPAMENGNDIESRTARALFLVAFVEWYGHDRPRQVSSGPGHNTTYKRAALEPFRECLSELYGSERNLCYLLEAKGGKMLIEPRAVTRHINISKFGAALAHAYYGGKVFAAERASAMGSLEKLGRTFLAPAIPILQLSRIIRILLARRKFAEIGLISVLPTLIVDLVLHAVGEVAGYWGDIHSAIKAYQRFEMDRLSCVTEKDRALLLPQKDAASNSA